MKYLFIFILKIFFCYSSWAQSVDSTFICNYPSANDYACFAQYFKNKPTARANYLIQTIRLNENIHIDYFSCMLDDVQILSNRYFDIDSDIGSFGGEVILKDKKDVITKIEQAHQRIMAGINFKICDTFPEYELFRPSKKKYRRLARKEEKYFITIRCLDDYVYNCPKDRVTYLKEYQKYIPVVILRLIQQDLDVLLEVETPSLTTNYKKELKNLINIYEQKLAEKMKE